MLFSIKIVGISMSDLESEQIDNLKNRSSKYEQFLNIPSMWTFSYMQKSIWGKLLSIDDDGDLEILISKGRIILAKPETVLAVGMI